MTAPTAVDAYGVPLGSVYTDPMAIVPISTQVCEGPGTLVRVCVPVPPPGYQGAPADGSRDPFLMDCVVYDGSSAAAPRLLLTLTGCQDTGPLSIAYTTGLFVVQTSTCSIALTFTE